MRDETLCYLLRSPPSKRGLPRHWKIRAVGMAGAAAFTLLAYWEMQTSSLQSKPFAWLAKGLQYSVESGPSPSIRFPEGGPYDQRLGYSRLPQVLQRLSADGQFQIESQARPSAMMQRVTELGLFPVYREKAQAGLSILGCDGASLAVSRYPQHIYADFASVPPLIVHTLLFIENRELLDSRYPHRNPAVEWDRLGHAAIQRIAHLVLIGGNSPGGSTLATQIEKYRHSPGGRTNSVTEKFRQMASASLRAYMNGEDTLATREQIVVDYLNTMPLSATPEVGEVFGLGDGLWAWYGAAFDVVNALLREPLPERNLAARASAYRQALSLLVAQRRPSGLLGSDRKRLADLTDSYLRLLAQEGVIDQALRDAALQARRDADAFPPISATAREETRKVADTLRGRLSVLLGVDAGYDLDRFDLSVETPLQTELQSEISQRLRQLGAPEAARAAGLMEERLLARGDPAGVTYSLILFERTPRGNLLRVQADSIDAPFDVNDMAKLDLGSTAKLRTLVTYLEVIAELHARYAQAPATADPSARDLDRLSQWALDYLAHASDRSLKSMLEAAMERRYSASPAETFFTGGGVHRFSNFEPSDNGKIVTLREALRQSINLPFVRLMRDIVQYHLTQTGDAKSQPDALRERYLERFADNEGGTFLHGFYTRHRSQSPQAMIDALVQRGRNTALAHALVFRAVMPDASAQALERFLAEHPVPGGPGNAEQLFEAADPHRLSLNDRAYLARVHPLELWLVGYLIEHPQAKWREVSEASRDVRQTSYDWLFKTRHRHAQDRRIQMMREAEAFKLIHQRWRRLGYPFDTLVPSYASAIGSSADRPASLAELMGIIVNGGWRMPTVRIDALHFAQGTPFETRVVPAVTPPQRVLAPEITEVLRPALFDVVAHGTARRLGPSIELADGSNLQIGGKTGTGDNRFETFGSGGQVLTSRAVSRAATFVFMIGDRYFGTITAYVPGAAAAGYVFTSALPVQVLKGLKPILARHLATSCPLGSGSRTITEAPVKGQAGERQAPG